MAHVACLASERDVCHHFIGGSRMPDVACLTSARDVYHPLIKRRRCVRDHSTLTGMFVINHRSEYFAHFLGRKKRTEDGPLGPSDLPTKGRRPVPTCSDLPDLLVRFAVFLRVFRQMKVGSWSERHKKVGRNPFRPTRPASCVRCPIALPQNVIHTSSCQVWKRHSRNSGRRPAC